MAKLRGACKTKCKNPSFLEEAEDFHEEEMSLIEEDAGTHVDSEDAEVDANRAESSLDEDIDEEDESLDEGIDHEEESLDDDYAEDSEEDEGDEKEDSHAVSGKGGSRKARL